eukprot:gb/GECH01014761.1/.p1 GENE.gb/GECH01014761.1/~~gb/GECH01014761.1/.p1  ORF type:complete len:1064 (+),score=261.57 gb/GECH01014761.1/:1-3192(+)
MASENGQEKEEYTQHDYARELGQEKPFSQTEATHKKENNTDDERDSEVQSLTDDSSIDPVETIDTNRLIEDTDEERNEDTSPTDERTGYVDDEDKQEPENSSKVELDQINNSQKQERSFVSTVSFADYQFDYLESEMFDSSSRSNEVRLRTQKDYIIFLQGLFKELAGGYNVMKITNFLLILRDSNIPDNYVGWEFILETIKSLLFVTYFTGNELIEYPTFKDVLLKIATRKFSSSNKKQTPFSMLIMLIDNHIIQYYDFLIEESSDRVRESLVSPNILEIFLIYKKQLQDIFLIFSTMDTLPAHSPTYNEIFETPNEHEMTSNQFMRFAESFEICPTMIPRHIIITKYYSKSKFNHVEKEEVSLTYPEFLECLGRMAMHIYSRFPHSNEAKTPEQKLSLFFESLGFEDRRKYFSFLRKAGLNYHSRPNKQPNKSSEPVLDREEIESLLMDKEKLKDELQRIYMFYCAYGDHLNLDLLGSSKFFRLIRDVKLLSETKIDLKKEDIDIIYVDVTRHTAEGKMTFPLFMEGLQRIALRIYQSKQKDTEERENQEPKEALVHLLMHYILPHASRFPKYLNEPVTSNENVMQHLEKYKNVLKAIFLNYAQGEGMISLKDFIKFTKHFKIAPSLVSKAELYRITRSSSDAKGHLDYEGFEQGIVKCAEVAYSKYPYSTQYETLEEKLAALLDILHLDDWINLKSLMNKSGIKVSYSPEKLSSKQKRGGASSSLALNLFNDMHPETQSFNDDNISEGDVNFEEFDQQLDQQTSPRDKEHQGANDQKESHYKEMDSLPPEDELDSSLRDIFAYYVYFGDKTNPGRMGPAKFLRFAKDCELIDNETGFDSTTVDLVFSEVTMNNNIPMTYELFCDSLTLLSSKKFPDKSATQALRELLLKYVLPRALRKSVKSTSMKREALDPDVIDVLLTQEDAFHKIFNKYSCLEDAKGSVEAINLSKSTLSVQELIKFSKDFSLVPDLLSIPQIVDIFFSVTHRNQDGSDHVSALFFDDFIECLAWCALKAYSVSPWNTAYQTNLEKAYAFLERLEISDPNQLAERLRRIESFAKHQF